MHRTNGELVPMETQRKGILIIMIIIKGIVKGKPIRPSFIFGTQIKIFLMKSESFLTLHRQQGNYHVQGPERYQEHRQNSPCDISGSTVILKQREYFLCAKKLK